MPVRPKSTEKLFVVADGAEEDDDKLIQDMFGNGGGEDTEMFYEPMELEEELDGFIERQDWPVITSEDEEFQPVEGGDVAPITPPKTPPGPFK